MHIYIKLQAKHFPLLILDSTYTQLKMFTENILLSKMYYGN